MHDEQMLMRTDEAGKHIPVVSLQQWERMIVPFVATTLQKCALGEGFEPPTPGSEDQCSIH